ncbi:YebC/PmpR family DNA-binding transcriptional regulator [Candidatus Izemoplasma sp. B36]|uniref:YebC/PmpR family DNA-binding transcriptional regulator n=1 Tax=Candidatus Izemoplasma sp. B36 TaxID=3242468 RepID=UPI0035574327
MGRAHEVRAAKMEKTALKKSKLYSKFGKELYLAAKNGGMDPDSNLKLKRLIEKAKQAQVPSDVIKRNIEKADSSAGEDYQSNKYEGFGPGGCTIIVDCLTDNSNRTFGEVRSAFTKTGGKIGVSGSVSYLYHYCSHVSFTGMTADEALEELMMAECEITDIETDDDLVIITGEPGDLDHIVEVLSNSEKEVDIIEDQVAYIPNDKIKLSEEDLDKFNRFLAMCEDLDDVQEVYHNVDLS